jgi:hypothetical protein
MSHLEDAFTGIYNTQGWGSNETVSGDGSMLDYTKNLRQHLPDLFKKFNVQTLLDAPCGDLNWMKLVLDACPEIRYIGGDIVKPLIASNRQRFLGQGVSFVELDITQDTLPDADLMICRDCLFHLPIADVWRFVENFARSQIPYLLTTSHVGDHIVNPNLVPGHFDLLNLMLAPYHFPTDTLYAIDDWIEPYPPRRMHVWSREQLQTVLDKRNAISHN